MTNGSQMKKELSAEKVPETSSKLPQPAERETVSTNEKTALTEKPVAQEPDQKDSLAKQSLPASPEDKEVPSTPTVTNSASFALAASDPKEATEGIPAPPLSYIINTPEQTYNPSLPADTPVSDSGEYLLPLLSFLKNTSSESEIDRKRIRSDAELLEKKLGYFGIKGEVMGISPGPVITTYEYKPDPGIKISKIVNLADDLALALSAFSISIVAPIPGKDVMGIEIPNIKKSLVPFIDIVTSDAFTQCPSKVPICLGKDIIGNPVVVELESMPHLLIAGATGTGKSVGLNAMITSILYKASPDEVKFLMIDPKRIELSFYNEIPHLLTPVITDMNKANIALQWMVREMDRRYNLLAHFQVRHIGQFNQKLAASSTPQYGEEGEKLEPLPFIVVIIDELADLMMTASRDIEFSLTRLAQMARAAGIHLILATQRPSVDVLTGIIKANFPTRISFQVSSKTDSRTIIDSNGAETLLGNGDMLFVPPGTARLTRVHGTYLSEDELSAVTSFIKKQRKPEYIFDVITEQGPNEVESGIMDEEYDEKYNEALEVVLTTRQASISSIQRALRVGYNRAARIVDLMEKKGVVGPSDGVRPRKVLTNTMNMM
jgi:S-DNA-T family DNA segregation ATPase FtsK/SpoIIIE